MAKQKLTDKGRASSVGLDYLIHVVNTGDTSQSPEGSSYAATIDQVVSLISGGSATFTGGTVPGLTTFTNGIVGSSISATTYLNLPADSTITGGTYSNGIITFVNNTGGTFQVTGLVTGTTDYYTTGTTLVGNTVQFNRNDTINAYSVDLSSIISGFSSGKFGIPNSGGTYTYYSTLQLAINAASSGQTVEMFTDYTETSATSVTLKDGVDISFNGHTYMLNVSNNTTNVFNDGSTPITCKLLNGTIKRTGNTSSTSSS